MSSNLRTAASAVLLATAVGLVAAQPVVAPRPASSAASAAAPDHSTPSYRSAFEGYRPFTEQPVTSWRPSASRWRTACIRSRTRSATR